MSEEASFGYEDHLERGRLLRQAGRPLEACRFIVDAIQADPRQPRAYLELALAQINLPDGMDQAAQSIDRALALEPDSALYLGYKAYIFYRLCRNQEAVEIATRALAVDPFSPMALVAKAIAHYELYQWEEAESTARRLLELNAEDSIALNLLAYALRSQDRLEEAKAVTAQVLARFPNDVFSQINAGYESLKYGRNREATGHFLSALRANPFFEDARVGLLQSIRARILFYRIGCKFAEVLKGNMSMTEIFVYLALTLVTAGLFVMVLFLAFEPVCNWLLLLNPMARRALKPREKRLALLVGVVAAFFLLALAVDGKTAGVFLLCAYSMVFILSAYLPQWADSWRAWRGRK